MDEPRLRHDLRMPLVAAAGWAGGVAGHLSGAAAPWLLAGAVLGTAALAVVAVRNPSGKGRLALAGLLLAAAVLASLVLRHEWATTGPVTRLAAEGAAVTVEATVVSDPRPVEGRWADQAVVRVRVHAVRGRGQTWRVGSPVIVLGDPRWTDVALGTRVVAGGRLAPADEPGLAALLVGAGPPATVRDPDVWWRGASAVRTAVRDSVAHRPVEQRALVPALVTGDDAAMPEELEADFRTTGLTHLTAVSGTNLTLVVGFLLVLARWAGARRHGLVVVGLLGIVGFVLIARTEPSVLRAAAMGVVGLLAFASDGRRRGLRALGVAVACLLLLDPALAVAAGFALSVLATGGIVLAGPPLQRRLSRAMPGPLAEAVAVPLAAQLACTPLVAALSGEVSLVAVFANLLAAPVVGPATVLGLGAGLVGLAWPWAGALVGTGAAWCVAWLVLVAQRGADLPGASVGWGTGAAAVAVLVVVCTVALVALPWLLGRRWAALAATALLVVVVLLGPPQRPGWLPGGWPPRDWVLVACDVGQGDALALSVGDATAIVVDAGPDPALVDRCLDRLGVETVPLVLLTHFHADHIDGLTGVLRGRDVGAIETTSMLDPTEGVDDVRSTADAAGVPLGVAPWPSTRRFGEVAVQLLWPEDPEARWGPGDGSAANDASVVALVESHGLRILLTGDVEPPGQARLAAALPDLDVDVLKVPHHGSRYQDDAWLRSMHAEVAVVSVGADNDYGHPDADLLDALTAAGTDVARTDEHGSVAVVARDGEAVLAR